MESTATSANDSLDDVRHVPESTLPHAQPASMDDEASDGATAPTHEFVQRAARSAHDAIDAVAARVEALVSGVGNGTERLSQAREDWTGAARDAIAQRPFAAIGIALLVGVGLASLRSSRER